MTKTFTDILAVGGKSNSLGRTNEVIEIVLEDKTQLNDLYDCIFNEDAWIRMRAIDAIEKVCRQQPEWLLPYIDKFQSELSSSNQPSIQWHLAQIYSQTPLTADQKLNATAWLKDLLSSTKVDWIVSANAMKTLVQFTKDGSVPNNDVIRLIRLQQKHASKSVVRKADKFLEELSR